MAPSHPLAAARGSTVSSTRLEAVGVEPRLSMKLGLHNMVLLLTLLPRTVPLLAPLPSTVLVLVPGSHSMARFLALLLSIVLGPGQLSTVLGLEQPSSMLHLPMARAMLPRPLLHTPAMVHHITKVCS